MLSSLLKMEKKKREEYNALFSIENGEEEEVFFIERSEMKGALTTFN
jgi:hypothetical protein